MKTSLLLATILTISCGTDETSVAAEIAQTPDEIIETTTAQDSASDENTASEESEPKCSRTATPNYDGDGNFIHYFISEICEDQYAYSFYEDEFGEVVRWVSKYEYQIVTLNGKETRCPSLHQTWDSDGVMTRDDSFGSDCIRE